MNDKTLRRIRPVSLRLQPTEDNVLHPLKAWVWSLLRAIPIILITSVVYLEGVTIDLYTWPGISLDQALSISDKIIATEENSAVNETSFKEIALIGYTASNYHPFNGYVPYEHAPVCMGSHPWNAYIFSDSGNYIWSSNLSLAEEDLVSIQTQGSSAPINYWGWGYDRVIIPEAENGWWGELRNGFRYNNLDYSEGYVSDKTPWARNHTGGYGAFRSGDSWYLIRHGENKNVVVVDYHNNGTDPFVYIQRQTVSNDNFDCSNPDSYSGFFQYKGSGDPTNPDNWINRTWDVGDAELHYSGFVALASSENTPSNHWMHKRWIDHGPMVWPSKGYTNSTGQKTSTGVKHPSIINLDGYVYIYYIDTSLKSTLNTDFSGRRAGVKVARAPLGLHTNPSSYRNYYNGAWTEHAMPNGFSKDYIADFYHKLPGKSTVITPYYTGTLKNDGTPYDSHSNNGIVSFSVAEIVGTDYLIGVEQRIDVGGRHNHLFRIARRENPAVWSEGKEFYPNASDGVNDPIVYYPTFLDIHGTSNQRIFSFDNSFYVIGSSYDTPSKFFRIKINLIIH